MFNWFVARDDVKRRMVELEERISGLRAKLRQVAEGRVESTTTQVDRGRCGSECSAEEAGC